MRVAVKVMVGDNDGVRVSLSVSVCEGRGVGEIVTVGSVGCLSDNCRVLVKVFVADWVSVIEVEGIGEIEGEVVGSTNQ